MRKLFRGFLRVPVVSIRVYSVHGSNVHGTRRDKQNNLEQTLLFPFFYMVAVVASCQAMTFRHLLTFNSLQVAKR